jgi:diguanylate cyclase (GGDEF)-like protein
MDGLALWATVGFAVLSALAAAGLVALLVGRDRERDRQARRDPLTQLGNRRLLAEAGSRLLRDLDQGDGDGSHGPALLLVDLDGFKDVNTAHGYPAGDAVLRETAARLTGAVRPNDVVARLGGDEFAVLAPEASTEAMRALADSVLAALRDLSHDGLRVTASVGWVLHPDDAATVDDLIAAADFCLRGAKLTGKDRALSAEDWAPEVAA